MTAILGISAFYHDSAATLIVDGDVVAAAHEERFTRKKHDEGFPSRAVDYCLDHAGITASDLDYVGFYDKPILTSGRLLDTYLSFAPQGFESFLKATPVWLRQKLRLPQQMRDALRGQYTKPFLFLEHHKSHAASAFYPSPFEEAAILTIDGVGEWATASVSIGRGNKLSMERELRFPHSLGLLYSAITYFTGFKVNSDEYKVMGLAPYGEPVYVDIILKELMDLKEDGSFRLDLSYFNYCQGLTMTSSKMDRLFDGPARNPEDPITKREMDLAASIQKVTEEIVLRMARSVQSETGLKNLCLAGGVALNCVANGRLMREGPFENIWVQPAAGDAGGSMGTAFFIWHHLLNKPREVQASDSQHGSFLGPEYSDDEIETFLESVNATYTTSSSDEELCRNTAELIADGNVIGWFQGRMEFGPRALGARSILGDPRNAEMQSIINQKVKFREGFRPFAPAVLRERVHEYFDVPEGIDSPYMLLVTSVRPEKCKPATDDESKATGLDKLKIVQSEVPAVTHVDRSARIQTIDRERHGRFYKLLQEFDRVSGCPSVVNTSFNLSWDPIVCTPEEAYRAFMQSGIDVLCMGRHTLKKTEQPAAQVSVGTDGRDTYLEELMCSPCHGAELEPRGDLLVCAECGHEYGETDGIRQMYFPHEQNKGTTDVTDQVKSFYEDNPFPNYDDHDSVRSLIDKSRRGIYACKLDESIPFNTTVLEVGCGTGQLTNFLGIACRRVVGSDLCLNSLRMANGFRTEHELERVRFVQMNLFRPTFKPEQFDVILCNGVLHHTGSPEEGFHSLLPMLKPGGSILVGLYGRYGRLATDARRKFFQMTGGRMKWVDPYLRSRRMSAGKERAWMGDQYFHPHESKHTIDEVLDWFDRAGLDFVRGIPSVVPGSDALDTKDLFQPVDQGSRVAHMMAQMKHVITGNKEGGLFVMIGRKREN